MSQRLYQAVLRALLQKSTWMSVRHAALDGAFLDTNIRLFLAQIDHLHGSIPDRDLVCNDLQCAIEVIYSGQLRDDLLSYVEAMGQISPASDYAVRELLARELLDQAATNILDSRNAGVLDLAGPSGLLARAQEIADPTAHAPTLTLDEIDLPSAGTDRGLVIPLGISAKLDEALGGGSGEGELIVILGRPKLGKTSTMCAIGASMVRRGYNVLHISMEVRIAKVARLYERAALRKSRHEWTDGDTHEARRVLVAAGGRLWLRDMAAMDVTPDGVEAAVRSLRRDAGMPVHCVILDYLELMAPVRGKIGENQIRYLYGRLGKQVRAMSRRLGTRVVTGWQVNREGAQRDTATETDISECWDIFKHVDTMIVLNQTSAERANHRMRLGVLAQREDPDGVRSVTVYNDWSRMIMEDPEVSSAVHNANSEKSDIPGCSESLRFDPPTGIGQSKRAGGIKLPNYPNLPGVFTENGG